jgi:hypothetical protein
MMPWLAAQYDVNGEQAKVLVIGDLNAYAKEDPVTALIDNGFTELFNHFGISDAYSYVYSGKAGQLDHALVNDALLDNVLNVTDWHINADEPSILDYNEEYKSDTQLVNYYAADAYRSSDHDPMVVELQFTPANQVPVASFTWAINGAQLEVVSTSTDDNQDGLTHQWQFGDESTATGMSASHAFTSNGVYQVTLTVTDAEGESDSSTQTVEVTDIPENAAPTAVIQYINLWFLEVFVSRSVDEDGRIASQSWLFNDGHQSNRRIVLKRAGQANEVQLTVTDNEDATDTASLQF